MKKRRVHKKKMNYRMTFVILIISLLISLLVFIFPRNYTAYAVYRMEIYLKKPDGEILKIIECFSKLESFECVQPYIEECSQPGEYYTNAITYHGNEILSESGWQLAYKC